MKKKTLHLTLSKEPFEVMLSGEKQIEFRKPSKWIKSRLFDKNGNRKNYDYVRFVNGYGKDKPFFVAAFNGFDQAKSPNLHTYSTGFMVQSEVGDFRIYIGNILNKGNINT